MVQAERIKYLNNKPLADGDYLIYWMQASQREEYNHALEFAIGRANALHKPLIVYFGLVDKYPNSNLRHFIFMLQGLAETKVAIETRGLKFILRFEDGNDGIVQLSQKACAIIVDRGYTRFQKAWRLNIANRIHCPIIQIESDTIIPVEIASTKEEYSAATIRPKIHKSLPEFLLPIRRTPPQISSLSLNTFSENISRVDDIIARLSIDKSVPPSAFFTGGLSVAKRKLKLFINGALSDYAANKNDPSLNGLSGLSPYLHFGQISPLYVALMVSKSRSASVQTFLEELIVRRELAVNYVEYNTNYDNFNGLPVWCRQTLKQHAADNRRYVYSVRELEIASTHDPYWNAAQMEMVITGKMHGYMRMYWGKKILEWSKSPEEAFQICLYLNDKYELDGRDPNGYAGVAWCFGKHDRPWAERPVFGLVRYMNDNGLKKKFDIDIYVKKIVSLQK